MGIKKFCLMAALLAASLACANAQTTDANAYSKILNSKDTYGYDRAPRYRGFLEESYVFGVGECCEDRVGLTMSHGCQITPYFFLGAGLGFDCWIDDDIFSMPVFAQMRLEFHKAYRRNASPFIDMKIGYSAINATGLYCNPSVGCHFYFGHSNAGISVRLGYVAQLVKTTYTEYHYESYYYKGYPKTRTWTNTYTEKENCGGVQLGVSIDW